MIRPRKYQIGFQEGSCPLKCKKCLAFGPDRMKDKKYAKMPNDLAFSLIDDIAVNGGGFVQPHIYTEPFANHDLKDIITYCYKKDIEMGIITNGILFDDEWEYFFNDLNENITISFSLDAFTQQTYEIVRGNYKLAEIENRIEHFVNNRKSKNIRISVSFVRDEYNYKEADNFLEKWKYIVDAVRIGECYGNDKKLINNIQNEKHAHIKKCFSLEEIMIIDTNGDVRVCCMDVFGDTYLGNVFHNSVLDIWNGDRISDLRLKIETGQLSKTDFCYGCEMKCFLGGYSRENIGEFEVVSNGYNTYYNQR